MRKSSLIVLIVLSACFLARSESWVMTITNSTRCIPNADISASDATVLTNGMIVVQGGYYTTGVRVYMPTTSGASTNTPTHLSGLSTGADGIPWLLCDSSLGRKGVVACVLSGAAVHYNRKAAATTNCPFTSKDTFDTERGDWRFIPLTNGTSRVGFLEL